MALQPQPQATAPIVPGLADRDLRRIQNAMDEAASANARRSCASAWRNFEAFAQGKESIRLLRPRPVPAVRERLA